MKYANKKEAQAALTAARFNAQTAFEARNRATEQYDRDARELSYQRCIREYEEAIFDYDAFDPGDD